MSGGVLMIPLSNVSSIAEKTGRDTPAMIQPAPASDLPITLHLPQLAAARPRTGMRSLGELVDCLVKYYEARSRIVNQSGIPSAAGAAQMSGRRNASHVARPDKAVFQESQGVFGWYDSTGHSVPATTR